MLSRAQEARVRDVLGNHPPGTIQMYCLEHRAAAVKIPLGHLADLAAFVRNLREHGACQTQYGGLCDGHAHETDRVLIWGPPTPMVGAADSNQPTGCRLEPTDSAGTVMDRRAFLGSLAGCRLALPLAAKAQQAGRVWRSGFSTTPRLPPLMSPSGRPCASSYASWGTWKDRTSSLNLGGGTDKRLDCQAWPPS